MKCASLMTLPMLLALGGCLDWNSLTPPGGCKPGPGGVCQRDGASEGSPGPSLCGGGNFLFCDGFEQASLDSTLWSARPGGCGTVEAGRAVRGARSLHVRLEPVTASNKPECFFDWRGNPPAAFYLRGFYYLPAPRAQGLVALYGAITTSGGVELDLRDGALLSNDYFGAGLPEQRSTILFPTDRWVCVEWWVVGAVTSVDLRIWLDGKEVTEARVPSGPFSPPTGLWLGYGFAASQPPQPAQEVWIDEVALSTSPVGCGR